MGMSNMFLVQQLLALNSITITQNADKPTLILCLTKAISKAPRMPIEPYNKLG